MVVAEVPLWVTHSSAAGASAAVAPSSSSPAPNTPMAQQLMMEQPTPLILQTKRLAIYSIHQHGDKFATGGGDGTVRIWNMAGLFCNRKEGKSKSKNKPNNNTYDSVAALGGGRYNENGKYSSSSSSSSDSGDSGSEEGANKKDKSNMKDSDSQDAMDNDDDNDSDAKRKAKKGPQHEEFAETTEVHDLNGLVRKKKGGSSTGTKPPAATIESSSKYSNNSASAIPFGHVPTHGDHKRLLCTLSAHTGSSVLCVRFSNSGHYLASAGDDAMVCIYAPTTTTTSTGTSSSAGSTTTGEHWSRIKLCRGHTLDVVGLAWAPDDSHLVSCSLDSDAPIIVWKIVMESTTSNRHAAHHSGSSSHHHSMLMNPYKVLGKGVHTSTVKGVTFDPAGTYLASSGDDPAIMIWRAHDDWGLESKVDKIFANAASAKSKKHRGEELSGQTLFRRLSWSTDGSHICSTNATIKAKHVASTIARGEWGGSANGSAGAAAANLVGHKQPIVVCQHAPFLLHKKKSKKRRRSSKDGQDGQKEEDEGQADEQEVAEEDEEDPDYAMILALGDKRGFVTVWSTKNSRPLFKLQCSESQCTVTDLSWGKTSSSTSDESVLLVSLLDGSVLALKFSSEEIGFTLTEKQHQRIFQLRYGIDERQMRRVGDHAGGPKLFENALQMALEEEREEEEEEDEDDVDDMMDVDASDEGASTSKAKSRELQVITKKGGKKRIRPVLVTVDARPVEASKRGRKSDVSNGGDKKRQNKQTPVANAMDALASARGAAESLSKTAPSLSTPTKTAGGPGAVQVEKDATAAAASGAQSPVRHQQQLQPQQGRPLGTASTGSASSWGLLAAASVQIPHGTNRVYSVDLPTMSEKEDRVVADCRNGASTTTTLSGPHGGSVPAAIVTISAAGKGKWQDELLGTTCCSISATSSLLAVGTVDGCVYLYSTLGTIGWKSGMAFRSHPPLVFGAAIVALQLKQKPIPTTNGATGGYEEERGKVEMLVVASDGHMGVYSLYPEQRLLYKGSVLPAMKHMSLSSAILHPSAEICLPKLARIQITDKGHLLLLLSYPTSTSSRHHAAHDRCASTPASGAGGSLQAFVYDLSLELWLRVSDSRFILSDFYSVIPSGKKSKTPATTGTKSDVLSKLENAVRVGATASRLMIRRPPQQHHGNNSDRIAPVMYNSGEEQGSGGGSGSAAHTSNGINGFNVTRSHCEDRMACAVALGSPDEFKHWLSLYARALSLSGNADQVRFVVDLLLGTTATATSIVTEKQEGNSGSSSSCWWLSSAANVLQLEKKSLVKESIIPEVSKNRELQRLTNEIALEVGTL